MPLCSSPPSDGGRDPICLSSTGQSATPQAPWFWRVLQRRLRARSVGDNRAAGHMAAPFPLTASVQVWMQPLPRWAPPGVQASAPSGLTGGSPGCPHGRRQLARQPSPPASPVSPSLPWRHRHCFLWAPAAWHTPACPHPSQPPWSRGKICTKEQPGCCSLGQPGLRSRTPGLRRGLRAAEEVVGGPDARRAGQGAQAPVRVQPCW